MKKQEFERRVKELERQVEDMTKKNHVNYERAEVREEIIRDMKNEELGEFDLQWLRLGIECAKDLYIAWCEDYLSFSNHMHVLRNWLVDNGSIKE